MVPAFILTLSVGLFGLSRSSDDEWYTVHRYENTDRWVELSRNRAARKLESLTVRHLAYVNETIPFGFPFFGEEFRQIRVTTQGFISLNQFVIVDTQYIGPLMANFKPYPEDNPLQELWVRHTSELSIVQWKNMYLSKQEELGRFDFQLQIAPSGNILLLYKNTPASLSQIDADEHVVTAGISGGATESPTQATRIPYRTIELADLTSNLTYELRPYQTCADQTSCGECVEWSSVCSWCEAIKQCSSGRDRLETRWSAAGCPNIATKSCYSIPYHYRSSITATNYSSGPTSSWLTTGTGIQTRPPATSWTSAARTEGAETTDNNEVEVEGGTEVPGQDNNGEEVTAGEGEEGEEGASQQLALSVVYIIVIVASSLSLIFVVAAFIILLWNKRRTKEEEGRRPETNTLIATDPVKC